MVRIRGEASGLLNALRQAKMGISGLDQHSQKSSRSLAQFLTVGAGATAALGLGKLIKDSVTLEAQYSKTMAQVAVATNAPQSALKSLDALAMKMGKDTVFSAQDAASAMLELSKGGLTVAEIKAGALADTLTLASAGEMQLGEAANTVVSAMGAFGMKASQTTEAVAAIAGGANASSASVSDMTMALAQAGTSAHAAGLSIQQTTAYLALLANQGIKGSDAGTSLRTMFSRLVPSTKSAKDAMRALNLTYLDSNNNLVGAEEIARRTQKAFKGLSDADRSRAVNAIFGMDAQRAVNAITAEGETGLKKYLKSTTDVTQAQKLAKAANSGTAGALEQLKGSIETAEIQFGKGLAPTIQKFATQLNGFVGRGDFQKWGAQAGQFATAVAPALKATASAMADVAHAVVPIFKAFNSLPDAAQKALLLAGGAGMLSSKLRPVGGLAGAAGMALGGFSGNAQKAGKSSKDAARNVGTLGASLKQYGTIAGVVFAADTGADIFDSFQRSGKAAGASADSFKKLRASLQDSNVGKYAGDLHINLDRLALDIANFGTKGEYYAEVVRKMGAADDGMSGKGKWVLDTLNPMIAGIEKVNLAAGDLKRITGEVPNGIGNMGRAVNQTKNELLLAAAGIDKYRDELRTLPTAVVTKVATPGALSSKEAVLSLARLYNLTPAQVTTIMKALDFATKDINAVNKRLDDTDARSANPTIDVQSNAAKASRDAIRDMYKVKNRSVTITITTRYRQIGNPSKGATGHYATGQTRHGADGFIMDFYGDGGLRENHVAQIAPAGTWRVWAEDETGGEAYIPLAQSKRARSMEIWAETGRRLGVQGFADGGDTGAPSRRKATPAAPSVSTKELADAVRAGARQGAREGMDGATMRIHADNRSLTLKTRGG
jgi:TP901 family phage tail tape measure protein